MMCIINKNIYPERNKREIQYINKWYKCLFSILLAHYNGNA